MQSFSLLLLGASLSTLATLNFSLAFAVGIVASPLSFIRPLPSARTAGGTSRYALNLAISLLAALVYAAVSPPVLLYAFSWYWKKDVEWVLVEIAKGWVAQGVYTSFVVWSVWWPAWVIGGIALFSGALKTEG